MLDHLIYRSEGCGSCLFVATAALRFVTSRWKPGAINHGRGFGGAWLESSRGSGWGRSAQRTRRLAAPELGFKPTPWAAWEHGACVNQLSAGEAAWRSYPSSSGGMMMGRPLRSDSKMDKGQVC